MLLKIILFTLLASSIPAALAQTSPAALRGTVTDGSGKPIAGAPVVARNQGTGEIRSIRSDAAGAFHLHALAPGEYEIQASSSGFVQPAPQRFDLGGGDALAVNLVLAPESAPQGQGSTPSGTSAASGAAPARISEEQLAGLPMNGRSYSQLATLQAGVSDSSSSSGSRGVGGGNLNVVGSRSTSNNYLIDGINIQDGRNNAPRSAAGVQLGSDAIWQVQVLSANYSAEYGRASGGVLHSFTRAGGSQIHGSVFEYFRHSKMDSRNFFDSGQEPPPFKRNQFGAAITGPIRKDKTLFAASFEAMRDRLSETEIYRYPDRNARRGLLPDPARPGAFLDVGVKPNVRPYLDMYPIPNATPLQAGVAEHAESMFFPTDENFFTARVDQSISQRDSLFVRYSFDDATSFGPQNSSLYRTRVSSRQQYVSLTESHIASLTTVNSFRAGYTRPTELQESISTIDIPTSLYFFPGAPKFGAIEIPGISLLGIMGPHPEISVTNTFQVADDLIVQKGKHARKFGVQIHRYRWFQNNSPEAGGAWSFNSLQSFMQGGTTGTTVEVFVPGGDKARDYRATLMGFYGQDSWNVRPGLQVTAGLRYEFTTLLHDARGRTGHLADLLHDTEVTVGPILKRNPSTRAFAPRVGITWSPQGQALTLLSAGSGLYYDQILRYTMSRRDTARPFYSRRVRTNFDASETGTPYFPDPLTPTLGMPAEARGLEYNNPALPAVLRYDISIQRAIGAWKIQAAYVGARGNHLFRGYEANLYPLPVVRPDGKLFFPDDCNNLTNNRVPSSYCRPGAGPLNPAFGSGILLTNSDGQSFYNALQLSASKSLGRGLSLQANYTFGKSVDDGSVPNDVLEYPHDRTLNRGRSDFDVPHRAVMSYFYNIPQMKGSGLGPARLAMALFGGWRLGGIFSVRSGTPVNATINVRNPGYLFAARQPDAIPGGTNNPVSGVSAGCAGGPAAGRELKAPDLYFDPCAFRVPEPGTLGTVGRNTIVSPSTVSADISLQREFTLDSSKRLQFRAEFFNFPNHTNFGKPSSGTLTGTYPGRYNPSVGRISSTNTTSRQIQFALRLSF